MALATVAIIALYFMFPEARAFIKPLLDQAAQAIDNNVSLFLIAFLLAMGATLISWIVTNWPRSEAPGPYRVIRRFRVG